MVEQMPLAVALLGFVVRVPLEGNPTSDFDCRAIVVGNRSASNDGRSMFFSNRTWAMRRQTIFLGGDAFF
jgi:hypothetical protein